MADSAAYVGAGSAWATIKGSLVEKCQENGWLRAGGYAWQDDPYLEEYPYDIREASSTEELRSFFSHGNWAIRQGVVYRDLAFFQQVDGGDEWWTLKKVGNEGRASDWLAFESCSFDRLSRDPHGFNDFIVGMSAASASECKELEYGLPALDEPWRYETARAENWAGELVECKILESSCGECRVKVYERPSFSGAMLEISDASTHAVIFHDDRFSSVTSASSGAYEVLPSLLDEAREGGERAEERSAGDVPRGLRAVSIEARESSAAINSLAARTETTEIARF